MTKFEVISQKPSKNRIFGKNGHFLTVFGQKWPIFEFFSKIRLEHFFTLPKPYLTAKFQKKVMSGCPDIAWHTYIYNLTQIESSITTSLHTRYLITEFPFYIIHTLNHSNKYFWSINVLTIFIWFSKYFNKCEVLI